MRTNPDISCRLVPSPSRYEIRWKRGKCGNTKIPRGFCFKEGTSSKCANVLPKDNDFTKQSDQTTKIRAKAKETDKVWGERYILRRMRTIPLQAPCKQSLFYLFVLYLICTARKGTTCRVPSRYSWRNCSDPFSTKSRAALKRGFVTEGKIIKRNLRIAKYKYRLRI